MDPKYIDLSGLVLAVGHIESVDFRGSKAIVRMVSGQSHSFKGDDAAGLRRMFAPMPPSVDQK